MHLDPPARAGSCLNGSNVVSRSKVWFAAICGHHLSWKSQHEIDAGGGPDEEQCWHLLV